MKKLFLSLLGVLCSVGAWADVTNLNVAATNGMAAEPEPVKADTIAFLNFPNYNDSKVGNYTSNWTATNGGTWTIVNFNNNNGAWKLIKCGSKSAASVASVTTPTISGTVDSIQYVLSACANVDSAKVYTINGTDTVATKVTLAKGKNAVAFAAPVKGASYKLEIYNAKVANGSVCLDSIYVFGTASKDPEITAPSTIALGINWGVEGKQVSKTFSIETKNLTSEVVAALKDGSKFAVAAGEEANTYVVSLKAATTEVAKDTLTLTSGTASAQIALSGALVATAQDGKSAAAALTTDEAAAVAALLENKTTTADSAYIAGVVDSLKMVATRKYNVFMAGKEKANLFEVFSNTLPTGIDTLTVGDTLVVKTMIKIYNGQVEDNYGTIVARRAYVAAVTPEPVVYADNVPVTQALFHTWDGFDASAVQQEGTPYWDALTNGTWALQGKTVFGSGNVTNTDYADLTGYKTLTLFGKGAAKLRIMFNRQSDNTLQEINDRSLADSGKVVVDLTQYAYFHLNAIKIAWGSDSACVDSMILNYVPAAVEPEPEPEPEPVVYADNVPVTQAMFHTWDGFDASAVQQEGTPYWDAVANGTWAGPGKAVYGSGNVTNTDYADLTGYKTLTLFGKGAAKLRIMFNRQSDNTLQEINDRSMADSGKVVVDLTQYAYFHLNAIKIPYGNDSACVDSMILNYVPAAVEPEPEPEPEVYTIAQLKASYAAMRVADNDSVKLQGYIANMFLKPTNFSKFGSVSIWLTDTLGGSTKEFELYNCYGLDGDTLASFAGMDTLASVSKSIDVDYVVARNGYKYSVGDFIVAAGTVTLFKSTTYELAQGCYILEGGQAPAIKEARSWNLAQTVTADEQTAMLAATDVWGTTGSDAKSRFVNAAALNDETITTDGTTPVAMTEGLYVTAAKGKLLLAQTAGTSVKRLHIAGPGNIVRIPRCAAGDTVTVTFGYVDTKSTYSLQIPGAVCADATNAAKDSIQSPKSAATHAWVVAEEGDVKITVNNSIITKIVVSPYVPAAEGECKAPVYAQAGINAKAKAWNYIIKEGEEGEALTVKIGEAEAVAINSGDTIQVQPELEVVVDATLNGNTGSVSFVAPAFTYTETVAAPAQKSVDIVGDSYTIPSGDNAGSGNGYAIKMRTTQAIDSLGTAFVVKVNEGFVITSMILKGKNNFTDGNITLKSFSVDGEASLINNEIIVFDSLQTEQVITFAGVAAKNIVAVFGDKQGSATQYNADITFTWAFDDWEGFVGTDEVSFQYAPEFTGIENLSVAPALKAGKYFVNGKLYIVRNGRQYNAEGAVIK